MPAWSACCSRVVVGMPVRPPAEVDSIVEIKRCIDESNMRESLRKVPHQPLAFQVVLLGKKPKIVPQGQKTIEELARIASPPNRFQTAHHPEAASEKQAFSRGQAVVDFRRVVAHDKYVRHEFPLDCLHGTDQ